MTNTKKIKLELTKNENENYITLLYFVFIKSAKLVLENVFGIFFFIFPKMTTNETLKRKFEESNTEIKNESQEIITENEECPICKLFLFIPYVGQCGHSICQLCMEKHGDKLISCPICRNKSIYIKNYSFDALLQRLYPQKCAESKMTSPFFIEFKLQKLYPDFRIELIPNDFETKIKMLNLLYLKFLLTDKKDDNHLDASYISFEGDIFDYNVDPLKTLIVYFNNRHHLLAYHNKLPSIIIIWQQVEQQENKNS